MSASCSATSEIISQLEISENEGEKEQMYTVIKPNNYTIKTTRMQKIPARFQKSALKERKSSN